MSATGLGDYLKNLLNELSWIFRPDTIPIKNNRAAHFRPAASYITVLSIIPQQNTTI
jgi:hypothetical protein